MYIYLVCYLLRDSNVSFTLFVRDLHEEIKNVFSSRISSMLRYDTKITI